MPTVYIEGVIGEEIGGTMTNAGLREQLLAVGDADPIRIEINTDGGMISEGMAIYNTLRAHPARKIGIVTGIAASMGSIILLACDERRVAKGAFVMIHLPTSGARGVTADQMQSAADSLRKQQEELITIYEARTKMKRDQIVELLTAETYLTAEEAVALGVADSQEDYDAQIPLAAVARLDRLSSKVPPAMRARAQSVIVGSMGEISNAVQGALRTLYPSDDYGSGYVYVCDLYAGQVIFERDGVLYAQAYTYAKGTAQLQGAAVKVVRAYVPVEEEATMRGRAYERRRLMLKGRK